MKEKILEIGEIVKNYWKGNGIFALVINKYISDYQYKGCNRYYYSVLNLDKNLYINRLLHPSFLKRLG